MPTIEVLSQHVADLIAAGEVVERPASVAKELVENAIDAGATFITVEIRSGGIAYLRVTDDGCGIAREDVPTSILRHSTSKIRKEDDLAHIATLGFRGEALAAIVAVSKMEMTTRRLEDTMGTIMRQEGGVISEIEDAGCPKGTSIIVRELFYNTPARMKFLKKDASEGAAVEGVVTAAALSHPNISFQMIREGKTTLHTPGDSRMESCVYSVLGRDTAGSMLRAKGGNAVVSAEGFVTKPIAARGNRAMQYFFVNGRFVKSRMLTAALEQAYANLIMKGRFPSCVLEITLPVELTDVNVHPTKTEIKFAREREVFDAVYHTVKNALMQDTALTEAVIRPRKEALPVKTNSQLIECDENRKITNTPVYFTDKKTEKMDVKPFGLHHTATEKTDFSPLKQAILVDAEDAPEIDSPPVRESAAITVNSSQDTQRPQIFTAPEHIENLSLYSPETAPQERGGKPCEEKPCFRLIGEVFDTYLIIECDEGMVLIDKHAAHERILFEKLKQERRAPQAQLLLSPVHVHLQEEEIAALEENDPLILSLGFEIDRIGMGSVAVRQVPDGIDVPDIPAVVSEIAAALQNNRRISEDERFDEILHSIACKAAIKAGMKTDRVECERLAREVMTCGDIRYCPHGRPVAVTLTEYQLERMFRRA